MFQKVEDSAKISLQAFLFNHITQLDVIFLQMSRSKVKMMIPFLSTQSTAQFKSTISFIL